MLRWLVDLRQSDIGNYVVILKCSGRRIWSRLFCWATGEPVACSICRFYTRNQAGHLVYEAGCWHPLHLGEVPDPFLPKNCPQFELH